MRNVGKMISNGRSSEAHPIFFLFPQNTIRYKTDTGNWTVFFKQKRLFQYQYRYLIGQCVVRGSDDHQSQAARRAVSAWMGHRLTAYC